MAQKNGFWPHQNTSVKQWSSETRFLFALTDILRQRHSRKKLCSSLDFRIVPGILKRDHHYECPAPSHTTGEDDSAPPTTFLSSFSSKTRSNTCPFALSLKIRRIPHALQKHSDLLIKRAYHCIK